MDPWNVAGFRFSVLTGNTKTQDSKRSDVPQNRLLETDKGSVRGQIWSSDFAVSLTIFSLVLLLFFGLFQQVTSRYDNWYTYQMIQYHAHVFSNQLLLTSGSPADWESRDLSEVESFGLADERNVLVHAKVIAFFNQSSYETIRDRNHVPYQFTVNISTLTRNETIVFIGNDTDSNNTAPVHRMATMNGTPVWVTIKVWQ